MVRTNKQVGLALGRPRQEAGSREEQTTTLGEVLSTVLAEAVTASFRLHSQFLPKPATGPDCCHESRKSKSRDFLSPIGEPPCLSPGQKQHGGCGAAEEDEVLCWVHKKGMLQTLGILLLQGFDKGIEFSDILLMHSQLLW